METINRKEEAYPFVVYRWNLWWLGLTLVPMLLLVPMTYLHDQSLTHDDLIDWLGYAYLWSEMVVYGFSLYKVTDKFGSDAPKKTLTRPMVRKECWRVYRCKALLVLHFLMLCFSVFYLTEGIKFIAFFSLLIPSIVCMLLFFAVTYERMAPNWERAVAFAEEMKQPKVRIAAPAASHRSTPAQPAQPQKSPAGAKPTGTRPKSANDNAPWEKYNREQDRYHNWACNHDDPQDCDHDDCY